MHYLLLRLYTASYSHVIFAIFVAKLWALTIIAYWIINGARLWLTSSSSIISIARYYFISNFITEQKTLLSKKSNQDLIWSRYINLATSSADKILVEDEFPRSSCKRLKSYWNQVCQSRFIPKYVLLILYSSQTLLKTYSIWQKWIMAFYLVHRTR